MATVVSTAAREVVALVVTGSSPAGRPKWGRSLSVKHVLREHGDIGSIPIVPTIFWGVR